MSTSPEATASSEGTAEIGPAPYFHRSDCHICVHQDGLRTGSELLDGPVPGGYVVEGEHFLVEHAPLQESGAGTVIVEARRHLLDFGEMTPTESAELGSILHRLVPAIKAATGVERVYYLAVMERSAHAEEA
jgi:diadenosine tetraphosphate (Ap4A) HIT family hydrolase